MIAPGVVAAQESPGRGLDQAITVDNSRDDTVRGRAGVQVGSTDADEVTSSNVAFATAHDCTGCQARATAFQAIFITGRPSVVAPANVAAAVNSNCHGCGSFAFAYQYVVQTQDRVRLSGEERDEIHAIREQAREDVNANAPFDQIDARLHALAQRFRAVIDGALRRDDVEVQDRDSRERRREDSEPSASGSS